MAEPISDETLALVRGKHGPTGPETSHGSLNVGIAPPCKCGYVWPCTIARMLARIDAAEARAVPAGPGDLAVKLSRVMHEYSLTEAEEGAVERATDILLQLDLDLRDAARLVPLSPTDTPEEA